MKLPEFTCKCYLELSDCRKNQIEFRMRKKFLESTLVTGVAPDNMAKTINDIELINDNDILVNFACL